jgi:hypothetical protein
MGERLLKRIETEKGSRELSWEVISAIGFAAFAPCTTSIDAAAYILPPAWRLHSIVFEDGFYIASVTSGVMMAKGKATTEACARTAAALRARWYEVM